MKRLAPEQDAFGAVLLDYYNGKEHAATVIERDDGFFEAEKAPRTSHRSGAGSTPSVRCSATSAGACSTSASAPAASRSSSSSAATRSSESRCRRSRSASRASAASKRTKLRALDEIDGSLGTFDTVVMFMNNFGLFESEAKAKRLLRLLHGVTSDRGRIVATTMDSSRAKREHRAYQQRNVARGRMPGQVRFRLHYRLKKSPWFDWLFVSPKELEALVRGTGWHVRRLVRKEGDSFYALVLEKDAP